MKKEPMRVLVACEHSGVVREAFNKYPGVRAISCDLLPSSDMRPDVHLQMDARSAMREGSFDLFIAHPPCTRLCLSGVRWLHERSLWKELDAAVTFFREMLNAPVPYVCVENPIPHHHAHDRIGVSYSQIVHPWQHGHGERNPTCLWLRNLPKLQPTHIVPERGNSIHMIGGGKRRSHLRSITFQGIADAMAAQWVPYILSQR